MQYRSRGCVLVTGTPSSVHRVIAALPPPLRVVAFARGEAASAPVPGNVTWVPAQIEHIAGHLGAFSARARSKGRTVDCARFSANPDGRFDLVLDLNRPPVLDVALKPPGYHAGGDATALARAIRELRSSVGTLHRIRYVEYERQACAHRRSLPCGRCIPACPAGALSESGDSITVDVNRCGGCALCDGVCVHGALRYAGVSVKESLARLATMIGTFADIAGIAPRVLLHAPQDMIVAADLPPDVLPFELPPGHAFRADTWLAALAQAAHQILIYARRDMAPDLRRVLDREVDLCRSILPGLAQDAQRIRVIGDTAAIDHDQEGVMGQRQSTWGSEPVPLGNSKRANLLACIDRLNTEHGSSAEIIALPAGAPVGEVRVDASRCNGCGACAEACAPAALEMASGNSRRLQFIESRCGQCGACVTACARHAVELVPRLLLHAPQREDPRFVT